MHLLLSYYLYDTSNEPYTYRRLWCKSTGHDFVQHEDAGYLENSFPLWLKGPFEYTNQHPAELLHQHNLYWPFSFCFLIVDGVPVEVYFLSINIYGYGTKSLRLAAMTRPSTDIVFVSTGEISFQSKCTNMPNKIGVLQDGSNQKCNYFQDSSPFATSVLEFDTNCWFLAFSVCIFLLSKPSCPIIKSKFMVNGAKGFSVWRISDAFFWISHSTPNYTSLWLTIISMTNQSWNIQHLQQSLLKCLWT